MNRGAVSRRVSSRVTASRALNQGVGASELGSGEQLSVLGSEAGTPHGEEAQCSGASTESLSTGDTVFCSSVVSDLNTLKRDIAGIQSDNRQLKEMCVTSGPVRSCWQV